MLIDLEIYLYLLEIFFLILNFMKNIFVKNYASLCGAFCQENKNSAGD